MNDYLKDEKLEEKVEEESNSPLVHQQVQNKMNRRTKRLLWGGGITGLIGVGTYRLGKWVFGWFYPPKFKKYLAITVAGATFYGFTHCNKTAEFIGDTATGAYNEVKEILTQREASEKTKKEAKEEVKQKDQELSEVQQKVEEETGLKVEFKNKYTQANQQLKSKDQAITHLTTNNRKLSERVKGLEEGLEEKNYSTRTQETIYCEPKQQTTPPILSNNELSYFVQVKGTNLAEIAREVTGSASNWRKIAEYNNKEIVWRNNNPIVIINIGERLGIPSEYVKNYSNVMNLSKEEVPTRYFIRRRGETIREAFMKYMGSSVAIKEILDYNKSLMPFVNTNQQEIFWIPDKETKNQSSLNLNKTSESYTPYLSKNKVSSRPIKIYPSRLSKKDYQRRRIH